MKVAVMEQVTMFRTSFVEVPDDTKDEELNAAVQGVKDWQHESDWDSLVERSVVCINKLDAEEELVEPPAWTDGGWDVSR
jgi:hypothetical protein